MAYIGTIVISGRLIEVTGVNTNIVGIIRLEHGVEASIDNQGVWVSKNSDFQKVLRALYGPERYGPADGFPLVAAVSDVARVFKAKIVKMPPTPDVQGEETY